MRERSETLSFLIDTCVISELVRPEPHAGVVEWISRADEDRLFLSVLTLGELYKGVAKLKDAARARRLSLWLEHDVMARFEGRITRNVKDLERCGVEITNPWDAG